jgi:hypothetical protein
MDSPISEAAQTSNRPTLLGYNEFLPRSFEADFDKAGVAWSEDEQVRLDVANARTRFQADVVIPVMHWGWENQRGASLRQRQLARLMIDSGADAVIGGHPHVTQDIEQYKGKPIIYSLGNFVFDGFSDEVNNTGWMLRLTLDHHGVRDWRIFVAHIDRRGIPHPGQRSEESCWERGRRMRRHAEKGRSSGVVSCFCDARPSRIIDATNPSAGNPINDANSSLLMQ